MYTDCNPLHVGRAEIKGSASSQQRLGPRKPFVDMHGGKLSFAKGGNKYLQNVIADVVVSDASFLNVQIWPPTTIAGGSLPTPFPNHTNAPAND